MQEILFPFPSRASKKWGFINIQGQVIVAPQFAQVSDFSEGLCRVYVQHLAGFINTKGEIVISPAFTTVQDFAEGRTIGMLEDSSTYVAIDTAGRVINAIPHRVIGEFHAGLARISRRSYTDTSGNKVPSAIGYINRNGEVVIEPRFTNASDFPEEGLALTVSTGDNYWTYINQKGEVVIQMPMNSGKDNGYGFCGGLLRVKENGWWGYKDKSGGWKLPPQYDLAQDFKDGVAWVQLDGKAKYIDTYGFEVTPKPYAQLKPFSEGLALVHVDNRLGYITEWGSFAFRSRILDKADSFSGGLACVKMDGRYGYLNKQGDFAIPCQYAEARSFKHGLAFVMNEQGQRAYINTKNEIVWQEEPLPKIVLEPLTFNFPEHAPHPVPELPKPIPAYEAPANLIDIPQRDGIYPEKADAEPAVKTYTEAEITPGKILPDGTQVSPDGNYKVEYACNEMKMSHWVCAPRITDSKTGNILFDLWSTSLWDGSARFTTDGNIILHLRKYPGSTPGFDIVIDPVREIYVRKDREAKWIKLKEFGF